MSIPAQLRIPLATAIVAFLAVLAAEKLHGRRYRAVARLASGPSGRPRRWVGAVPMTRAAALAAMAWALVTLYYQGGGAYSPQQDAELVRNIFDGLPVWYVMEPGKTNLGTGVCKTLLDYPKDSTTVFICTDGDTTQLGSIPEPPASIGNVYVLGVGDPEQGTFIDGHTSRQEASVLRTLAGRLRGEYVDVNQQHLATLSLGTLAAGVGGKKSRYSLVDLAIFVLAAALAAHAGIAVLLEYFGSDWRTVRPRPTRSDRSTFARKATP